MHATRGFQGFADLIREDVRDDAREEIDGRIAVHDSNHVEVKLDCQLGAGRASRYRIETYFFAPRSLGLGPQTYTREQFYSDLQTYLRFKTPAIPLGALAERHASSPLTEIYRLREALEDAPRRADLAAKLGYELRIFGCVVRANLRDRVRAIGLRLQQMPDAASEVLTEDIRAITARFLDDTARTMTAWRALRPQLLDEPMPRAVRDTYAMVDEYLSLMLELKLTALIRHLDRRSRRTEAVAGLDVVRQRAVGILMDERSYRGAVRYASAADAGGAPRLDDGGERLEYRRGMLKKFVTQVLWLEIDKQRDGTTVADLGAGIAAGAAMLFAALATIVQLQWWMINTAPFVVAAVITYILKDRIKDWLKRYFSRRTSRWLSDYSVNIRDPLTGANLGRAREAFSYVPVDRVPEEILRTRRRHSGPPMEIAAKQEVVFKYDKEIRLENPRIKERMHLEDYDLNDITRFSLWQLLMRADDPEAPIPVYDPDSDRVKKHPLRKVYHLNMVMVFRAGAEERATVTTRHLRVIFDKRAILRLEELPVPA